MKKSFVSLAGAAMFVALMLVGYAPAYAGCTDDVGAAVFAVLSGGASVAACELGELIDSIKNFVKTVNYLANNVAGNAQKVANAAVGAVSSTANDIANTVGVAQHDLGNAVSQAQTMTSPIGAAPLAVMHVPAPNGGPLPRGAALSQHAPALGAGGGARPGLNPGIANRPILLKADPQQVHAALERGLQALTAMKGTVDQEAASRINGVLQRARNQATSHLGDVPNIVQTAMMAPINALLDTLNDLVQHPTKILDPIATINTLVNDLLQKITVALNHITDVITSDAIATLGGVESDVRNVQSTAQEGDKLLGLMRRAHQEGTQSALQALESELNAVAPRQNGIGQAHTLLSPSMAGFRFAPVRSQLHATLAHAIAPTQKLANDLGSSWAAIRARHPGGVRMHPLDPGSKANAKAQLDRMFLGKSPSEIARAKQSLLNRARQRYGSNPQLMAAIEQNLDSYLRTHSLAAMRAPVMVGPAPSAAPRNGIGVIRQ